MAIDRWGSHCGVGAVTDLQCSTVVRPPAAPAALAGQRGQFWGTRGACRVWPGTGAGAGSATGTAAGRGQGARVRV